MKITNDMINDELRETAEYLESKLSNISFKDLAKALKLSKDKRNDNNSNINVDSNLLALLKDSENLEGLEYEEKYILRKDKKNNLKLCIYKDKNKKENAPCVLWMHGGGYGIGTPEQSIITYKQLIDVSGCVVIAPEYTLSIEEPYPAALEDCYESLLWIKNNAKELGIRDDQIMIGGESAGGGLTAALSLYARDKKEVNIAFQMPLYPMIDYRMCTESAQNNNTPIWNSKRNEEGWKLYLGNLYEKEVPEYASPSLAKDYSNLPATLSFIGDLEPFRDETIEYIENLKNANVPVMFEMYKGCYHGFDRVCPDAKISKDATQFFLDSFKYAVENYFAKQN
ncbi:MAG: alpha/beta hydrolase [Sarcina sp.]